MPSPRTSKKQLRVPQKIVVFIRRLHPQLKRKIKTALKDILNEPNKGKALKDDLAGLRSYKVGRFRIIYREASKTALEIIAIGPRKIIYEETYRMVKKELEST